MFKMFTYLLLLQKLININYFLFLKITKTTPQDSLHANFKSTHKP